ncbi:MAG: hypothetical protein KatS3mg002_0322 [Candidatus Woesearchaeota archaeon]|nr:MAG: hypothetical protein KatS3mg002_0322 [Candidatus Woesearchaeota archaeon]
MKKMKIKLKDKQIKDNMIEFNYDIFRQLIFQKFNINISLENIFLDNNSLIISYDENITIPRNFHSFVKDTFFINKQKIIENKLKELKEYTEYLILSKYPIHKQLNILAGLYDDETLNKMIFFIKNIRRKYKEYENLIKNEETSIQNIHALIFDFDLEEK